MRTKPRIDVIARTGLALALALALVAPAAAQGGAPTILAGKVIDAATGLPLSNARVTTSEPSTISITTGRDGTFALGSAPPGLYTLVASANGYQTAESDQIQLQSGEAVSVTLDLQRVATGRTNLRTIGHTTTQASASLQKASVLYQQVNAEQATEQGFYRLGDSLRELPGVVNSGSDTAAPADDINLNIRGIGNLETLTLIDGHPVGYGLKAPYNFDISPAPLFRDVLAVYGSGANQFYPVNAIGGVFDFQTINPTPDVKTSFTQQVGTFSSVGSILSTTGTSGKIGYAFAASAQGIDGPIHHDGDIYSYSASQDQGALDAVRNTAFYDIDESSTAHTFLGKLVVPIARDTKLMLSGLTESFYDNKTGNGDLDYQPTSVALNTAQGLLGGTYPIFYKDPVLGYIQDPGTDGAGATAACPSNLVPLTNGNGTPSGTYTQNVVGSVGAPSSNAIHPANKACVTPQQFAQLNTGINGAGPAFQTYNLQDYHTRLTQGNEKHEAFIDAYVDDYLHHYDRDLALPYHNVPGDNPQSYYEGVVNTGVTVGNTWTTPHNSSGIGFYYNNASYNFISNGNGSSNAAVKNDFAGFVREAYTFPTVPLTLYGNLWGKNAGETNTTFLDPRAAAVVTLKNDVFRLSAGESTTQPYIAALDQPFSPISLGALNGSVSGATCATASSNPISIGSGSNAGLKPERGVDTDVSYGHRFYRDSQIQATFYNTNVFDKIYGFVAPLSVTGTSGIDPAFLGNATNVVRGLCGQSFNVNAGLGISSSVNLAHVRAQGLELSGRQRIVPQVALDYDYGATSVILVNAPAAFLATNGKLIPGAQLPNVPLHQYNLALNWEFRRDAVFRIGYHHVSDNNTKNLPPYGYADALVAAPVGSGRLAIAVSNLFNSQAFDYGLIAQGVPLAQNAQAGGTPVVTERFGLPFRQIDFTYTLTAR